MLLRARLFAYETLFRIASRLREGEKREALEALARDFGRLRRRTTRAGGRRPS